MAGPPRRRWEFWRSPAGQPPWARPALLGIAAVAALLYARNLAGAGLAHHYLPADAPAVPDRALTGRFAQALNAAGLACTAGATVTTDAPYRTTAEEIRLHHANGVRAQEMEAAALFALGQVRGLPVASAVVIDGVPDQAGTGFRIDRQRAGQVLRDLFAATIAFLGATS
jgi:uridine phosphorylase